MRDVEAKVVSFFAGARISVWWAGFHRDYDGSGLLSAWLRMRPVHEFAKVDAFVPAGEALPAMVTDVYFRGLESRKNRTPTAVARVALTTDSGKKVLLTEDCFNYLVVPYGR